VKQITTNEIIKQLNEYHYWVDENTIKRIMEYVLSAFPEEIKTVIPSLISLQDGPRIDSIFLISENLLCEVPILTVERGFDFIALKSIKDYRFILSKSLLLDSVSSTPILDSIEIILLHEISNYTSKLVYIGAKSDLIKWLNKVLSSIPIQFIYE